MSIAYYIASDKKLKKITQKAKKISGKMAKEFYEKQDNAFLNSNIKRFIIIEEPESFEITKPYYSKQFLKKYTSKKHIYGLNCDGEDSLLKLIEHLKNVMKKVDEIEIWAIWLGEEEGKLVEEIVSINKLKESNLALLKESSSSPKCLIVRK